MGRFRALPIEQSEFEYRQRAIRRAEEFGRQRPPDILLSSISSLGDKGKNAERPAVDVLAKLPKSTV